MKTNYSIIFPKRREVQLISSPFTEICGSDEIIGRTLLSVVSSGSECGGFMGYGDGGQYPCETGYANIVEVLETGSSVTAYKEGDYVFTTTPHKLYNKAETSRTFPIPHGIPLEKAILCRFPAVSMTSLIHTSIKPTEPVLVMGLGIVGLMCAQVLRHWGYEVYATDPGADRQAAALACGIPHAASSVESFELPKKTIGLAVDCTGSDSAIMSAIPFIRQGGELALVGVPWRKISEASAHDLLRQIFYSYLHVYSGFEWSIPYHSGDFDPNSNLRSMETALRLIADGSIVTDGIYELFDPNDCITLYPALAAHTLEKPCAVFDWRNFKG